VETMAAVNASLGDCEMTAKIYALAVVCLWKTEAAIGHEAHAKGDKSVVAYGRPQPARLESRGGHFHCCPRLLG